MAVTSARRSGIANFARSNEMSGPGRAPVEIDFLVVAGGSAGGGGDGWGGGGGGAGGYRSSVTGENSGGGVSAERQLVALAGQQFTVKVGAGGPNSASGSAGRGGDSQFGPVVSIGGGKSRRYDGGPQHVGGSGAGGMELFQQAGVGLVGQGYAGASGVEAGAGGAGAAGAGSTGGAGVASSITGSSVTRAKGGNGNSTGSGGANTGDGGAGNRSVGSIGGGGSGVVIVRYPSSINITVGAGLTSSTSTSGDFKVTTFTAGTDTVTIL